MLFALILLISIGCAVAGVLVLAIAAFFAPTRSAVIRWGVIGSVMIALNCLIMPEVSLDGVIIRLGNVGPLWFLVTSVAFIALYFGIALARTRDKWLQGHASRLGAAGDRPSTGD